MYNKKNLKGSTRGVRFMLAAGVSVMALSVGSAAYAQEEEASDDIIITGTRITNPNLVQASQIRSIDQEEANYTNVFTVEGLLREIPGVVPDIGPGVNNGNGGAQTLNLRGIGTERNLVLLDGQRIVPFGLDGLTDTNNIPLSLIERTDVITGGASTVYGADAVSGVANFITKRNFEGLELTSSYGVTERGDGETVRVEGLVGGNFADDRGNAVFSLGYQKSNPVLQGDRAFSEFVIDSSDGSAGGSINSAPFVLRGTGTGANAITNQQFNPDTGLVEPGFTRFNFAPLNLLQTPVERYNLFGKGTYDITPNIEAYIQGFYTNTEVVTNLAPSAAFGIDLDIPIGNPFLTDGVRDQLCVANGISAADCLAADAVTDPTDPAFRDVTASISRRFVEGGPRIGRFESDTFQISGGLRGDYGSFLKGWDWNLHAQYGRTVQLDTNEGFGLRDNLEQGLLAIDENTCVDPSGGCVPVNLFGPIGSFSQEAFDFINVAATTTTRVTTAVIQGNSSGDLGNTFKSPWADENISVATGFEYRRNKVIEAGDFLSQQPGALLGAGGADPAVTGSFDVIEGYAETIIPVFSGKPWAESMTLEAGVRVSDYNSTGTSITWKAGTNWEIVPGYSLRSVFQHAVRSPNIGELFDPQQSALGNFATDPCAGTAPVGNAALTAICQAQGAPSGSIGFISLPAAGQVSIVEGGNPDLDVEKADTLTVGVVIQPPTIPSLSLSFDYFNISIDDAITTPAESDVIGGCFGPTNAALDFNAFCQSITRNALTGSLNLDPSVVGGIALPLSNLGTINTSGFDFGLSYVHNAGNWGNLAYSVNGTYTIENKFRATPLSINRECAGFYSPACNNVQNVQPELQINQRVTLSKDIFDISLRHRFLNGVEIEEDLVGTVLPEFASISSTHYFDLSARASLTEQLQLTLTVNNLTDNGPPEVGSDVGSTAFNNGNTFPTVYDSLGRRFVAAIRLKY